MARMYPASAGPCNGPLAEMLVFEDLKKLPDDYRIFHSVQWTKKKDHKNFTWLENDFLIFHPRHGIIVLEVKGGSVYCENGVFHQVNTETGKDKIIAEGSDPYTQAKNGMFYYRDLLREYIKPIDRLPFMIMMWFPGCRIDASVRFPQHYMDIREAILDCNDLSAVSGKSLEKKLSRVFSLYGGDTYVNLTPYDIQHIVDTIAPDFQLIPSPSIVKVDLERQFIRLTNEQKGLLDYIEEQNYAAIQGAAGTGKTVVALTAAKRFAEQGRKVLFLCFNRFLYEHLRDDYACENVDYFNIHTFAGRFSSEDDMLIEKNRIKAIQSIDIDDFIYDDVIIDEAQDLENDEVVHLKTLAELKDGHFYAFFDRNQIVLKEEIPEWIEKSECKLLLTRNCRNTYEIACTAYNVIDTEVKQKVNIVTGSKPTVCFAGDSCLQKLEEMIRYYKNSENGYSDADITILSMKPEEKSILTGKTKIGSIAITRTRDNKHVFVTTAKKFKGLEGNVIIITDIDESCFENEKQKRTFYVACSRAKHKLSLLIDGDKEKLASIAHAIKDGGAFSSQGTIMMKTKTQKWQ